MVECGQHWEKSSEEVAIQTLVKFLRCVGIMEKNFGAEIINEKKIIQDEIDVFKVGEIITIQTENFKFKSDWQGFDKLEKGAVIGFEHIRRPPCGATRLLRRRGLSHQAVGSLPGCLSP